MTNFIPVFPLSLVVYPGQDLNLHIFEPRYKQLISECYETGKPFGIPAVVDNELKELGTLVEIVEISKVYEGGEMDIKTRGLRVFRMLELIRTIPDKLYSGAIVSYPENELTQETRWLMEKVLAAVKELHRMLQVNKSFKKPDEALLSYDIAAHIGLTLQEEYELLGLMNELQRQEYLKRHLTRTLPLLAEMEQLKEKIKLNGHFRNIEPFQFKI
ncbi:MAG: LON peptidase substrate-binding domain-containing protein [Chitinophagaceae bacterium]